jgi:S1-C subfamily serine protease
MTNLYKRYLSLFLSLIILLNFHPVNAANFNEDLREIRAEINRDNLQDAIKKIKKIKISNENEQEKIDLLFGDIYLKINQIDKAEEFYQKTFFTSNEEIEARTFIGLAEVRLAQGKLNDAINYAEKSIKINSNKIRPKIILAIAKTRLGDNEEAFTILNDLYYNKKDAEVALAISDYYISFNKNKQALDILQEYIKKDPNNIKILNQLAVLQLVNDNEDKAIEYKMKVYKYHEFNKNRDKQKKAKAWILSIDPKYFDKPLKSKKVEKEKELKEQKKYQEEEINNYQDNQVVPNYEKFEFAANSWGSGFIVGKGKYVITNYHVIHNARRIGVRNGLGQIRNAKVVDFSKKLDLALLQLDRNYHHKISLKTKIFKNPRPGDDVVTIGFPGIGETAWQPTITEGIVSKVFTEDDAYPATFMTTIAINPGNSGGPIFDLNGNLVGVAYASLNKLNWIKAGLAEEISLPTDMGYAIKSRMINKIFEYKQNKKFNNKKYSRAALYQKMLPSVVFVAISK